MFCLWVEVEYCLRFCSELAMSTKVSNFFMFHFLLHFQVLLVMLLFFQGFGKIDEE